MYLILVICDASIVSVLLSLKVNSCENINKTHSAYTLEVRDEGKFEILSMVRRSMNNSLNACVLTARLCTQFATMKIVRLICKTGAYLR